MEGKQIRNLTFETTVVATYGLIYTTTIANSLITPTTQIIVTWGSFTDSDENFADPDIMLNAIPGSGQFKLTMETASKNRFGGTFYINYLIK